MQLINTLLQSWYSRTWPRKAAPITQIAHESITTARNAATEIKSALSSKATDTEKPKTVRSPSLAMTLGKGQSSRSLPVDATTTKVHATTLSTSPSKNESVQPDTKSQVKLGKDIEEVTSMSQEPKASKQPRVSDTSAKLEEARVERPGPLIDAHQNKAGWFGWLSRADTVLDDTSAPKDEQTTAIESANANDQKEQTQEDTTAHSAEADPQTTQLISPSNKRSWLQMWGNEAGSRFSTSSLVSEPPQTQSDAITTKTSSLDIPATKTPAKSTTTSKASSLETSPPPALPGDGNKSSGWVFWSRDSKPNLSTTDEEQPHVGEIAISDTPSQSKPKRLSISLKDDKAKETKTAVTLAQSKDRPASRAESLKQDQIEDKGKRKGDKKIDVKQDVSIIKAESSDATAIARPPTEKTPSRPDSPIPAKRTTAQHVLLPSFKDTIRAQQNPTMLQQLTRLLYYTKDLEPRHLSISKDVPKINNALAIGVHGYFPAPFIRTVLGQPTGTSIKFADMAAKSIQKWTHERGYECKVKTAALEGEGKIAERVELLWNLLLNWIEEVRKTDFVLVACHSQGVPVAIMLVAKLIQFGCVNSARVGICAMAGVNLGPFQDYKSRWISGSAGELFDFGIPDSKVSTDYLAALDTVLKFGVRLTFVGSIDDQLVSLDSSIFSPISHPHIYRAVSIDARVHAPSFLSNLVGFAIKLRNLGVADHGLIRELSVPLAGSLYTGEGHSRLYEDDAVYDLAVSFALETTALANVPIAQRPAVQSAGNPYILPFAMRGILEEEYVKTELHNEATDLLKQFDDWKPTTKVLKDVKFRLEGIRSRL